MRLSSRDFQIQIVWFLKKIQQFLDLPETLDFQTIRCFDIPEIIAGLNGKHSCM